MARDLKRTGPAVILRLFKHTKDHYPPAGDKPLPAAFRLTDEDIEDGKRRGVPVLFSVFNAHRTSVKQARTLRRQHDNTAFCWHVAGVEELQGFQGHLTVLNDPNPWADGPGARGHVGIAGLLRGYERPKGPDKNTQKRIITELIDRCEKYAVDTHPKPGVVVQLVASAGAWIAGRLVKSPKGQDRD